MTTVRRDPGPRAISERPPVPGRSRATLPLIAFYLLFGASGVSVPFLPAYLDYLGFRGTAIGFLLAISPAAMLIAPPLWADLVDRSQRPVRVLTLLSAGALVGLSTLLVVDAFLAVALGLTLFACFYSATGPIADGYALVHAQAYGRSFARLRLFGSLGCAASATLYGLMVDVVDRGFVVVVLGCVAAYLAATLALKEPTSGATDARPRVPLRTVLVTPGLYALLGAAALHWIACAPYHGIFALYVRDLGLTPAVVGLATGVGIGAEIVGMFAYPVLSARVAPTRLLLASFLISAARWVGVAMVETPTALVALSALHAASFGVFYVSMVALIAERAGEARTASGQALFFSATFGLGGAAGNALSGTGYELLGGANLFLVAAFVELLAAAALIGARPVRA